MKDSIGVPKNRVTLKKNTRMFFVAMAVAIGLLCVTAALFRTPAGAEVKASAAELEFQGGATTEMLNYALNFGEASDFAVFGGRRVRNQGDSVFRGRVGAGEYEGVPGYPEGAAPENNGQAKQDMKNALRWIGQLPCAQVNDTNLGGKTFGPGVYCLTSADLAGEMTISGGGDANARFVFRVAGGFNTGADSNIKLIEGARATNVYIVADGPATLGANSRINANVISRSTVTMSSGTNITGKSIGVEGDVNVQTSSVGGGTGVIEICKALSPNDPIPAGTIFTFTVTGVTGNIQVPAGGCSAPVNVAAGNVTVTETLRANTAVISIVTNPANRRVSFDLALRQVVVAVPEGDVNDQTVVTFTNQTTRTGTLEICKRALDDDVTGFFQFTVQGVPGQTFSVPTGFCTGPITVTIPQTPGTDFTVNVTELARANFRLENVTTFPATRFNSWTPNQGFDANGVPLANNTNGGFANVDLVAGGGVSQQTTVNFFNRSLPGVIKVCKITADPATIPVGTIFRFEVSGLAPTSPTQTLPGVPVTRIVDVVAGPDAQGGFCQFVEGTFVVGEPVLIRETGLAPNSPALPGGATFADTRVSRIRASTAFAATPVTVQTAGGPVTINAPNPNLAERRVVIEARNTTAEVDFTNFVFRPAILKICKIAGAGVPVGTNFTFSLSLVNPLTSLPVNTAPFTIPAGSCVFAQGPFPENANFPGIGTFNFNTQIVVTEAAATGFNVTAITSPTGGPLTVSLPNRTGTLTLNQSLLPNNLFNEIAFTNTAATTGPNQTAVRFDFDGDRRSDPVIFRPGTGTWWYSASSASGQARATQFGLGTDKVVAADYDGDGRTDFAIYRNGEWHVLGSTAGYSVRVFGVATDIPQPGDYDGDGSADLAVYRPSDGTWHILRSRDGYTAFPFGISTDSPEAADFDGDGRMDAAVYRSGVWYVLGSTAGFSAAQFGLAGDRPVAADYDGDRKADFAVYRSGVWHILRTNGGYTSFGFGMNGDEPVPADYDGDGKTDAAVYRSSNNVWHILRSNPAEASYTSFQFGSNGDVLMNY